MKSNTVWWAVYTTQLGNKKIYSDAGTSRNALMELNATDPNFRILYGPASNQEVVKFLDDLDPEWCRNSLRKQGLEWLLDAGHIDKNGDAL